MLEECQTKWDFEQCIVYRDKIYELQKAVFLTTTCPLCGTLTYYTHHTRITRSHFRMCSQRNHPTAHKWTLHAHTPHSNATLLIMDLFVSCVVGLDEAQCTESAIVSIVHMLMLCLSNMHSHWAHCGLHHDTCPPQGAGKKQEPVLPAAPAVAPTPAPAAPSAAPAAAPAQGGGGGGGGGKNKVKGQQ